MRHLNVWHVTDGRSFGRSNDRPSSVRSPSHGVTGRRGGPANGLILNLSKADELSGFSKLEQSLIDFCLLRVGGGRSAHPLTPRRALRPTCDLFHGGKLLRIGDTRRGARDCPSFLSFQHGTIRGGRGCRFRAPDRINCNLGTVKAGNVGARALLA